MGCWDYLEYLYLNWVGLSLQFEWWVSGIWLDIQWVDVIVHHWTTIVEDFHWEVKNFILSRQCCYKTDCTQVYIDVVVSYCSSICSITFLLRV